MQCAAKLNFLPFSLSNTFGTFFYATLVSNMIIVAARFQFVCILNISQFFLNYFPSQYIMYSDVHRAIQTI